MMRTTSVRTCLAVSLVAVYVAAAALIVRDNLAWAYLLVASADEQYVGEYEHEDRCCTKSHRPGCACWSTTKCFDEGGASCVVSADWVDLECDSATWEEEDSSTCSTDTMTKNFNSCKVTSTVPVDCPEADAICPENYEDSLQCVYKMRKWNDPGAASGSIIVYTGGSLCAEQPTHICN